MSKMGLGQHYNLNYLFTVVLSSDTSVISALHACFSPYSKLNTATGSSPSALPTQSYRKCFCSLAASICVALSSFSTYTMALVQ